MDKRRVAWTIGGVALLGCAFAAGGYFLDNPTKESATQVTEQRKSSSTIFKSEMLNDEKTLIAALAWYGYEQKQEPQWYAWKNSHQVDYMDLSHIKMQPQLSITGDKHYYQFQPNKSEKTTCGFVASKDKQMFYLYTFRDEEKKVKPLLTVKRSALLRELNEQKARPDIERYAGAIQMTTVKAQKVTKVVEEKKRKQLEHNDLWSDEQNDQLLQMMNDWGETNNQKYAEVILNHDQDEVPFPQITLTNKIKNDDQALLSIDSQFADVNTSLSKGNDHDYHILAAYSGASEKNDNLCYLFMEQNGEPIVMESDMSKSIGSPNGKLAANFVPTDDETLQANFAQIFADKEKEEDTEESEEANTSDSTSESTDDETTSSQEVTTSESTTTSDEKDEDEKEHDEEDTSDLLKPDKVNRISSDESIEVTTIVEKVSDKTDETTTTSE